MVIVGMLLLKDKFMDLQEELMIKKDLQIIQKDSIFAKYDLPLKRLNTTGSGEKEKIVSKLNEPLA